MTRPFRYFLSSCIGLALLVGIGWGIHLSALLLADQVFACAAPCRWDRKTGYSGCSPLEAHLDIKSTPEPLGRGQAIWYRAVVKNNTCELIELDSDFFLDNRDYAESIRADSFIHLLVADAAGRRPPTRRDERKYADAKHLDEEIHPYVYDTSGLKPFIEDVTDRRFPGRLIALPPRTTIAASPSALAPYREVLRDVRVAGMDATAISAVPLPLKHPETRFAAPPPGYRRLSEYAFTKGGSYTARLVINEEAAVSRFEGDGSPLWRSLKRCIAYLADPRSSGRIGGMIPIRAASETATFVISR